MIISSVIDTYETYYTTDLHHRVFWASFYKPRINLEQPSAATKQSSNNKKLNAEA